MSTTLNSRRAKHLRAAHHMDWEQVRLHGGEPCFHICEDGRFCGRALQWDGHESQHSFVSLVKMIRTIDPIPNPTPHPSMHCKNCGKFRGHGHTCEG